MFASGCKTSSVRAQGETASRTHPLTASRPAWVGAVLVPPVLYVLFVLHFSTNALEFDDWNMVPFLHASLHGHFSWGQLWSQYGEPRIPLTRGSLLFFAHFGHLNTRAPILLSAVLLVVAYGFLLTLAWRYLGRLRPFSVLACGVVWFSLVATQSALWAFEIGWYFVIVGFMGMLAALVVPRIHHGLWLAVAILMAVVATLGTIQGFVVWPVGLLCIFGSQWRSRKHIGVWLGALAAVTAIYLVGYNFAQSSCKPYLGCQPTSALAHPLTAIRFFLVLVGNVIPGQYTISTTTGSLGTYFAFPPTNLLRYDVVGVVVLVMAVVVIVQSLRKSESASPPMLMVVFALLFDAVVTWGRLGEGVGGAVIADRYEIAGPVLLAGIVLYALRHLTARPLIVALVVFIGIQLAVSTSVGITAGRNTKAFNVDGARLVINLNQVPDGACQLAHWLIDPKYIPDAETDHLAEFGNSHRKLGPFPSACRANSSSEIRPGP